MDYEIVEFQSQPIFRDWLTTHGKDADGIWLRIYKKASNVASITYAEALDEALCFGWIDGRWEAAYDTPTDMQVPGYFLKALKKHPKAESFYDTLNKANTYAIAWRLQTAKTEVTCMRRAEKIIEMLNAGKKLH
ncbi:MAG TPA: YdeI/OmpD-associated family protein [Candidatus Saccharimonadales bacterium]|nr:YdeI/OmpD-associated family protein [Candidatus Saccharimonadales bacterium]